MDKKQITRKRDESDQNAEQQIAELTAQLAGANKQLDAFGEQLSLQNEKYKLAERLHKEHLHFEIMLAELSARFVNLPAHSIDNAIREAQQSICELLGIDRSVLWQIVQREPVKMSPSHVHQPGYAHLPEDPVDMADEFPWILEQLLRGEMVKVDHPKKDLPPEADRDRKSFKRWGVKSTLIIPLWSSGKIIGALSFARLRKAAAWQEGIHNQIQLVAQLFTNALARRQFEESLETSLRFEELLVEISARFVNLPADRIDDEIKDAERLICQCLGIDLASLWQWSDEAPHFLTLTHLHAPPEGPEHPEGIDGEEAFPWVVERMKRGEVLVLSTENMPPEAARDQEMRRHFGVKSSVVIPLSVGGAPILGVLAFDDIKEDRSWPEPIVRNLGLVAQIFSNALARKRGDLQLRVQLDEINSLKKQLEKENIHLRKEIEIKSAHKEIVGRSPAIRGVLSQVEQVARTDATVLIEGETGTGKELLARAVHRLSSRGKRPLVTVNCASLPPTLVESELFGREKGAYTGALTRMTGRFEAADGATLLLDEIGELPLDVQAKLLRVLEQGCFERLGSVQTMKVDVRIIAATNQDLAKLVAAGKFRKDLYYRLNVFPIHLPPLRERSEDIPLLTWSFVRQYEEKMGKRVDRIPNKSMDELQCYGWPGNIRELRNVIERALIVTSGRTLEVCLPRDATADVPEDLNLEETQRRHITAVLQRTGWRLSGRGGAADMLGLKRTTLQSTMKRLGIQRPPR